MKAIILSCTPAECEKIVNGDMSILVRKKAPKEVPFKAYIYCTKGRDLLREVSCWNTKTKIHKTNYRIINLDYCTNKIANGKVIGEFICDKVNEYEPQVILCAYYEVNGAYVKENLRYNSGTCLSYEDMVNYSKGKTLYGWHISDLKIYDKPKELSEFKISCNRKNPCCSCCNRFTGKPWDICNSIITRPPQSWQFVEELEK